MPVRKRVFLGLVTAAVVAGGVLAGVVWAVAGWSALGRTLLIAAAWIGFTVAAVTAFGVAGIALSVWGGRTVFLAPFIRLVLETGYPLSLILGPLVGISKKKVQLSFVAVNNALADVGVRPPFRPEKVLILVPHCLQRTECPHRITVEAHNCRRCGGCQIGAVVELAERRGVRLAVATGGGMARKIIHDLHPGVVIAVACERDLTSGLLDTYPLPVYGIVNERPEGYCVNTRVNLERLEETLGRFLGETEREDKSGERSAKAGVPPTYR